MGTLCSKLLVSGEEPSINVLLETVLVVRGHVPEASGAEVEEGSSLNCQGALPGTPDFCYSLIIFFQQFNTGNDDYQIIVPEKIML